MNNVYVRKDYHRENMYVVESYESLLGYWSQSEPMNSLEAEKFIYDLEIKLNSRRK